jgi:hypothetical protein
VRGCGECQRNKPDNRGRQGLPLSIDTPKRAWDVLCMDFIGPLPRTASGHDAVLVVVDKLTRYATYIPCSTRSTAQEVFALLRAHVFAHHGMPSQIISDRDPRFTSRFWEGIWAHMQTELKRSTSFHPQTDGTTERQNRTLIEALRAFVDARQMNWDVLLPDLQFAHNDTVGTSTGFTPHRMVYGVEARTTADAVLAADGVAARGVYPGVAALAKSIEEAKTAARATIEKAQAKQRKDAARGRRPVDIAVGDMVWLANKNMRLDGPEQGRARKLEPLYFGPYAVLEMHGSNAAKIELPAKCKLHPVFNVDLLRKFVDGLAEFPDRPQRDARPGPVPEEDLAAGGPAASEPTYEVEAVIGKRRRGSNTQYKLRWRGWPVEQATWTPAFDCDDCAEKVAEYEAQLLQQQQRVGAVHAKQLAHHERAVDQWTLVAATRRQHAQPTPEQQAAQRAAAKAAVTINVPLSAMRPKPDRHGQVDVGSQRCVAETKKGGQCSQQTHHGCYCWVHRAQIDGTRIKASSIPGAGKSLWAATRDYPPGAFVASYTGDLVPTQAGKEADGFGGSHYVLELSEAVSIDAARTNTADGRMVNDARGSGQRANVRFSVNQRNKTAVLRTTRWVRKGQEFRASYGRLFWAGAKEAGANGVQRAEVLPAVASPPAPIPAIICARERVQTPGDTARTPIVIDAVRIGPGVVGQQGAGYKGGVCNRVGTLSILETV